MAEGTLWVDLDPLFYTDDFSLQCDELIALVEEKIDLKKVLSATLGTFRIPRFVIQKFYQKEKLFAAPLTQSRDMISHEKETRFAKGEQRPMDFNINDDLKHILQPFLFVLKEGKTISHDYLDYSLLMLQVSCAETIRSPGRKQPSSVHYPFLHQATPQETARKTLIGR